MKLHTFSPALLLFLLGALGYPLIELLWRGRSHWTMSLAGGMSMVLLLYISRTALPLPLMWVAGAISITAIEFTVGCIVNRWLHWQVWDYSELPFNLLGQISLPFTLVWFLLSIPGIAICQLLERALMR